MTNGHSYDTGSAAANTKDKDQTAAKPESRQVDRKPPGQQAPKQPPPAESRG